MFLFFVELDWQKNDKATILVESIQLMKDLRAEVKRLKIQHEALLEESRDVREGVMSMSLMSPNAKSYRKLVILRICFKITDSLIS